MSIQFDKVLNLTTDGQSLQRRLDISFDKIREFSQQFHTVVVTSHTAQSFADSTFTLGTYDTINQDSSGLFSTNTNQVVIKLSGVYLIQSALSFAPSSVGKRNITILRNGITIGHSTGVALTGGFLTTVHFSIAYPLLCGDSVGSYFYQDSGGVLNSSLISGFPTFSVIRVGD